MRITVEGTPEECQALREVLLRASIEWEEEIPGEDEIPLQRPSLILIKGGLVERDRKNRTIELPKLPR